MIAIEVDMNDCRIEDRTLSDGANRVHVFWLVGNAGKYIYLEFNHIAIQYSFQDILLLQSNVQYKGGIVANGCI